MLTSDEPLSSIMDAEEKEAPNDGAGDEVEDVPPQQPPSVFTTSFHLLPFQFPSTGASTVPPTSPYTSSRHAIIPPNGSSIFSSFHLLPLAVRSAVSLVSPSSRHTTSPAPDRSRPHLDTIWGPDERRGSYSSSNADDDLPDKEWTSPSDKEPSSSSDKEPTSTSGAAPTGEETEDHESLESPSSGEKPMHVSTKDELEAFQRLHPLPGFHDETVNRMRYRVFSLYVRLQILVLLANFISLAVCIPLAATGRFSFGQAATGTSVNLFAATLMRHENYINLIFWAVTRIPTSAPVNLRRNFAKFAYSQGGIHAGSGISTFAWLIFYITLTCIHFRLGTGTGNAMAAMSCITGFVVLMIIACAHPGLRARYHDYWEIIHRYGGYIAVALVWAQIILIAVVSSTQSTGKALTQTPAFWFLIIISCFIIHPYLYVRRLNVRAERLSGHATRLWFDGSSLPGSVGARLSHNFWTENHAFATIPNRDGQLGWSVVVSNAGDWTKQMINNPPKKLWLKGAPTRGVIRISSLFKPIVVVTTGSGIGPCLSFLQTKTDHPVRVLWSARFPEATYGREVISSVMKADPRAIIIDTKVTGQPDLEALTYALYAEIKAEAIVIISNPTVTRDVVYAMESRKVPAFGAIFDS